MNGRKLGVWKLVRGHFLELVYKDLDANVIKSKEEYEQNVKRTIQVMRRTCALVHNAETTIEAWSEMGEFFYNLMHCEGKNSLMWGQYLLQATEAFRKVVEVCEEKELLQQHWDYLVRLGQCLEKTFYDKWSSDDIPHSDWPTILEEAKKVVDLYQKAVQTTSGNPSTTYRLHAARAKIVMWAKEISIPPEYEFQLVRTHKSFVPVYNALTLFP